MLTILRKDSNDQERHVYCSSDSPELELLLNLAPEHLEPSDMDTLSHYLHHLSPREQLWMIEHAINDQAPRMIAAKHNVTTENVKGWCPTETEENHAVTSFNVG
ncbi:hypothetical protein EPH95_04000 [Salicibibacter halophilus]|uniref:Uncharacterized protein n=2 Tax=Salicibibacter halophilus TaxID=2502791 RepID=A0A514LF09_9BACI|nr:hypothetical protein EPH95_04000 [Salicibibacter halophilus]